MIKIITVFGARRLYGSRSHKTKRLLNKMTAGKETEESGDPTEVGRRVHTRDQNFQSGKQTMSRQTDGSPRHRTKAPLVR